MTRYYNDDIVEEIRSRIDIVELVSETVELTRKGNRYWGKCPFHGEKTASFCVTPEKNMFYCFGCNVGGDIFTFLMKSNNMDFPEALESLATKIGIEPVKASSNKEYNRKRQTIAINSAVAKYFQECLTQPDNPALEYLANRNITLAAADKFQVGYADEAWNSLENYMVKKGFSIEDLKLAGLIKYSEKAKRYYDLFRNRIIFPIFAYNGDIVGFGGRAIDDSMPKYLNSPETDIFSKRRNLYGLYQSKQLIRLSNQVILVEGYTDCIKLNQYGIENVVASLGTAFTNEQAQLIKKYAEAVIVLYDGDEAGQRETLRVIDVLVEDNIKIEVLTLPGSIDPDEYLDLYGKEDFLQFLKNNKVNPIEFKLNRYISKVEHLYIDDKIKIINNLRSDFSRISSELEKDYIIKLIARKLETEENLIYREFNLKSKTISSVGIKRNKKQIIKDNRYYINYSLEEKILATMIVDDDIFNRIAQYDVSKLFSQPDVKQLAYIIKNYKNNIELEKIIREHGLETIWARIMLCSEEKPLKEYEINDFLKRVAINKEQRKWHEMYQKLDNISQNGDFESMLNFILSLDSIINTTRERRIL
ncbi:MAG TPA: DNA primase [Syntrophomonadaceae bacterium]|nr:DNA primase [Syntrophomonadaceae bacterium]